MVTARGVNLRYTGLKRTRAHKASSSGYPATE